MGIISFWIFRIKRHYDKLLTGTGSDTLTTAIESLLNTQKSMTKSLVQIDKQLIDIETKALFHIQKIGVVRFNPFSDTGGSQSFTITLLDGKNNGVVMTSLYARTGNRWYIKQVKEGKGIGLELSKEEESAVVAAKPISERNHKYE
jgi:hypothetical protein